MGHGEVHHQSLKIGAAAEGVEGSVVSQLIDAGLAKRHPAAQRRDRVVGVGFSSCRVSDREARSTPSDFAACLGVEGCEREMVLRCGGREILDELASRTHR